MSLVLALAKQRKGLVLALAKGLALAFAKQRKIQVFLFDGRAVCCCPKGPRLGMAKARKHAVARATPKRNWCWVCWTWMRVAPIDGQRR